MAEPLISLSDFESRYGRSLGGDESIQVTNFIDDASALVREIAGWADDEPSQVPSAIVPTVVGMVRRALDNPHGHESERVGNYQYSGAKTEGIFATRDEVRAIRRTAGKLSVGSLNLEGYIPFGSDPA